MPLLQIASTTKSVMLQAVEGLKRGAGHDTYVCAAGYLIGEYGTEANAVAPLEQFKLLQACFLTSAVETKVALFSVSGQAACFSRSQMPVWSR